MSIKNFGKQVETVWETLRPLTKKMIERALADPNAQRGRLPVQSYDNQADTELSKLLNALDLQVTEKDVKEDPEKLRELQKFAETTADVLLSQSATAEIFIQLAEREIKRNNYAALDKLADSLSSRYSVSEISEIVRQTDKPQIRALAFESLSLAPLHQLVPLLSDPVYGEIIAAAIEQKAYEYESVEAKNVLKASGLDDDDDEE